MSISQNVFIVTSTPSTVVAPTHDHVQYVIKNLQPKNVDEYARDGLVFALFANRSLLPGVTENLSIVTGPTGAQFDYYQMVADNSSVYATIIESPTVTTVGSVIPTFNLNRNFTDTPGMVIKAASVVTGGTMIQAEFVTASVHGGGAISSQKVVTLKPNTQYVLQSTNLGNQTTSWYTQIGFSEQYNGLNTIWLGTLNESFALRAGEELVMPLTPGATINAVTKSLNCKLSVMRQR